MSDLSEAISTDDAPAPEAPPQSARLLGDPATEGNEAWNAETLSERQHRDDDDLHEPLNSADVQN